MTLGGQTRRALPAAAAIALLFGCSGLAAQVLESDLVEKEVVALAELQILVTGQARPADHRPPDAEASKVRVKIARRKLAIDYPERGVAVSR